MDTQEHGFDPIGVAAQIVVEQLSGRVGGDAGGEFEYRMTVVRRRITKGLPANVAAMARYEMICWVRRCPDIEGSAVPG